MLQSERRSIRQQGQYMKWESAGQGIDSDGAYFEGNFDCCLVLTFYLADFLEHIYGNENFRRKNSNSH